MRSCAHLHHLQGKLTEARAAYNLGLVRDPNNTTGLGERKELDDAVRATEKAKELLHPQVCMCVC